MTDQIADRLQFEQQQLRDEIVRLTARVETLEKTAEKEKAEDGRQ